MKAHYLTLIDGRRIRLNFSMSVLCELELLNINLAAIMGKKPDTSVLRTVAWCCARDGEKLEGRELDVDEQIFGSLMGMQNIVDFSEFLAEVSGNSSTSSAALAEHSSTALAGQKKKKRFPRIFRRRS